MGSDAKLSVKIHILNLVKKMGPRGLPARLQYIPEGYYYT